MRLALFDLDGTLLPIDSDHGFNEFVIGLGWAEADSFRRRNDGFLADYLAGTLDIHAYVDFATAPWRDRSDEELRHASAEFVERVIRPAVRDAALQLVERHQREGDLVAIVTATNDFVTRPIADVFGVEHLIATDLQRDEHGRITGAIAGTPAFRDGKVLRVDAWLGARGCSLQTLPHSTFYSDSTNDLPLLERVNQPVATNPSTALAHIARQRGWTVLELFSE